MIDNPHCDLPARYFRVLANIPNPSPWLLVRLLRVGPRSELIVYAVGVT